MKKASLKSTRQYDQALCGAEIGGFAKGKRQDQGPPEREEQIPTHLSKEANGPEHHLTPQKNHSPGSSTLTSCFSTYTVGG